MSLLISMAAFALAASISPGPVNVVALSSGMQFGLGPSLRHVLGATVGFVVLLLFTGFGLHEVLKQWPILTDLIRWAGMAFLLYLAWKLAMDNGRIAFDGDARQPKTLLTTTLAMMRRPLRPKANPRLRCRLTTCPALKPKTKSVTLWLAPWKSFSPVVAKCRKSRRTWWQTHPKSLTTSTAAVLSKGQLFA